VAAAAGVIGHKGRFTIPAVNRPHDDTDRIGNQASYIQPPAACLDELEQFFADASAAILCLKPRRGGI
jgi:hypothetical protein